MRWSQKATKGGCGEWANCWSLRRKQIRFKGFQERFQKISNGLKGVHTDFMTLIFQEISDALQGTQSSKGVLKGFQRFSSHFGQFQVVHGRVFGTRQECFRKFHGVSGGLERFQMRFSGSYLLFF